MGKKWGAWVGALALILVAGLAIADTTTTNLLLTNQTTGGNPTTWGDIADTNFETIDNKLGDVQAISTTGGDTTLTSTQEIVNALSVTGTLVSNATLTFSGRGGTWLIRNATTGDFTLTALTSGNTGVEIPQGTTKLVYCCISSDIASTTTPASKGVGEVFATASATCPDESILSYGQAISRTTYSDLFAIVGTTYGTGDGSTTFNVPDLRGRTVAGQDDMGGTSANRLTDAVSQSLNGDTLGDTGGEETHTMTSSELVAHTHTGPSHTHTGPSHTHTVSGTTGSDGAHTHTFTDNGTGNESHSRGSSSQVTGADNGSSADTTASDGTHTHTFSATTGADGTGATGSSGTGATGSSGSTTAFNNIQPTIILNYCIYTGV